MARLPTPGGDNAQWGQILNDFLTVEHVSNPGDTNNGKLKLRSDGTLSNYHVKPSSGFPKTAFVSGVQTSLDAADSAIQSSDTRLADGRLTIKKGGVTVPPGVAHKNLNLIEGTNIAITTSDNGSDQIDVTLIDTTSINGHVVEDETTPLTARSKLSIQGANVVVSDSAANGRTVVSLLGPNFKLQKDGVDISPQRPTLDFISGSYVVDDSTNSRTRIYVEREYFNVTDPRIGIVMNAAGDQGAKLQTAVDMMTTSGRRETTMFIPPGIIECHQEIVIDSSVWTRILGAGAGEGLDAISAIYWPNDLGPGTYGLKPNRWVEKLTLLGPGTGSTTAPGDLPAEMSGIFSTNGANLWDVRISGFGAGLGVQNDHQEWHNVDARGNGYGMNWVDNGISTPTSGGLGDHYIDSCDFRDQTRASIALSDSATIGNGHFTNCKFGDAPFAFYRYAGSDPARGTVMIGVIFDNGSIENCGNAVMYDEPYTGNWGPNFVFDGTVETGTFSGPLWPGKPTNLAAIDVSAVGGIYWRGAQMPVPTGRYQISADAINNVRADYIDLQPFGVSNAKPFHIKPAGLGNIECTGDLLGAPSPVSGQPSLSCRVANESIARGDVVEMQGYAHVQKFQGNASTSMVMGVSIHSVAANEVCMFAMSGSDQYLIVNNKSSSLTIPNNSLVKPSAVTGESGGVMVASLNDRAVIGRIIGGDIGPSSSGRIMLSI